MHISDIIQPGKPSFSFEFFPPKTLEAANALYETIKELSAYHPSFVSVTYGAGGTTRDLTHDLVLKINGENMGEVELFEKKMDQWIKEKEKRIIFFVKRGIHTLFLELEPDWDNT